MNIMTRGAAFNPPNPFERLHIEEDADAIEEFRRVEPDWQPAAPRTAFFVDDTQSLITKNASPDLGFDSSLNPYRGCEHGCSYCYARRTHEYLGFSAGLDFESKIMVKLRAPKLLRTELSRPSWRPQVLACSGVTDPYQPVEGKLAAAKRKVLNRKFLIDPSASAMRLIAVLEVRLKEIDVGIQGRPPRLL